jgi:hypothetical protein
MPTGETMSEGSDVPPMPDASDSGAPETASLPIDFCGQTPPAVGDIIKAKVVSVDQDNGSIEVACVPSKPMGMPTRGIKAAVASLGGS